MKKKMLKLDEPAQKSSRTWIQNELIHSAKKSIHYNKNTNNKKDLPYYEPDRGRVGIHSHIYV